MQLQSISIYLSICCRPWTQIRSCYLKLDSCLIAEANYGYFHISNMSVHVLLNKAEFIFTLQRKRFDDELLEEKQKKQDFKKQQNMYETIYGSVPASVNKTKINNKRPREEQTPHGKSKLVLLHCQYVQT